MISKEVIERLDSIMGGSKELMLFKGQLLSPQKVKKQGSEEYYYTFVLKVLKSLSCDEYGQGFNTFNFVMSSEYVKNNKITDDDIKNMKSNEVMIIATVDSHVKTLNSQQGANNQFRVNNISLYVSDIVLIKTLDKVNYCSNSRIMNL